MGSNVKNQSMKVTPTINLPRLLNACSVCCILTVAASPPAGAAEFIPLGIIGTSLLHGTVPVHESRSYHLSDDGRVVVGRTTGPLWNPGPGGVFRWTRETGMVPLDNSASLFGYPRMSADGSTVAWYAGRFGDESRVWTAENGLTVFNDPSDLRNRFFNFERPFNNRIVSSNGSVIAGRRNGSVVRWSFDTGFDDLGIQAPNDFREETLISGDGNTIAGTRGTASGNRTMFRWTADLGAVDIGSVPGANWHLIADISNDGSVLVGLSGITTANSGTQDLSLWR
jgi:uncharacterized membrane protein